MTQITKSDVRIPSQAATAAAAAATTGFEHFGSH